MNSNIPYYVLFLPCFLKYKDGPDNSIYRIGQAYLAELLYKKGIMFIASGELK
jgi:hypothetical protein